MAWLEFHQTMPTHRKTLRLARALRVTKFEAIGIMCCLWCWGLDNANIDGIITGIDAQDIVDAVGYDCDPEEFIRALLASGYLDRINDSYMLHDWHDYAGKLMDKRKSDAERKRASRLIARKGEGCPADVQWTGDGNLRDSAGTVPNPTVPFNTLSSSDHNEQGVDVEVDNTTLIEEIVDYLNTKTGSSFRATTEMTRKLINGRLFEGYALEDFKRVIDDRCSRWKGTDQEQYLRPPTLFRPSNFESYINSIPKPEEKSYFNSDIDVFKE